MKQPVALIAAYAPFAHYPEESDKYAPKHRTDLDKSTLYAANEIRYAANQARQKLQASSANATKDLQSALRAVSEACADATEDEARAKCDGAVKALDVSLGKTAAAAVALGVTAKYPRLAPESITDEAKAAIAPFLKVKGPGANDLAYYGKRRNPKATPAEVIAACQAAQSDAVENATAFDKSEEPFRLIGTPQISMDARCRRLNEVQAVSLDLGGCRNRKKAKTAECKLVCGKAESALADGLPAATFAPLREGLRRHLQQELNSFTLSRSHCALMQPTLPRTTSHRPQPLPSPPSPLPKGEGCHSYL